MKVVQKAKAFYKRHENKVLVTTAVATVGMSQAHANLDMTKGTEQLGLALAAIGLLGAAKLAPAALSWVWAIVTRNASRG